MSTDFNAATWTASDLLTEVFRTCRLPDTGTVDYTPLVVLREATDAIWNFASHAVASARGGRMATSILRAVPSSSVVTSGQDYELPPMAIADALDSVTWVSASGLSEVMLQVVPLGLETTYSTPTGTGTPRHFALLDGTVRVYPAPNEDGSLRIVYQRRHGQLVAGSDTALVTNVVDNAGAAQVTLTTTPLAFVGGAWVDLIGSSYPYRIKVHGAAINSVDGGNTFTLSTTYAAFLAAGPIGDTVATYGRTPYVHLPMEMRGPLTQHIASKILHDFGDTALATSREQSAERGAQRAGDMLSPRTKATHEKAFNPRSLMRGAIRGRR